MDERFVRFDRRDIAEFESILLDQQGITDPASAYAFFLDSFKRNKCKSWSTEVNQDCAVTFYWPAYNQKESGHTRVQKPVLSVKVEFPYQFAVSSVNLNQLADDRCVNAPADVFSIYQDAEGKDSKTDIVSSIVSVVDSVYPGTKQKFDDNRKFSESIPRADNASRKPETRQVAIL